MRMYSGWAIIYESFLESDCVTLFDQGCVMWGRGRRDAATQVRSGSFYFIPLNNCRQSGESLHWRNVFQFLWATNEVLWSDILSWALGWSSNVAKEWRGRKISIHNMRDWHRVLSVCLGRGRSRAGGRSPPSTRFSEVIQTFLCFRLSFLFLVTYTCIGRSRLKFFMSASFLGAIWVSGTFLVIMSQMTTANVDFVEFEELSLRVWAFALHISISLWWLVRCSSPCYLTSFWFWQDPNRRRLPCLSNYDRFHQPRWKILEAWVLGG